MTCANNPAVTNYSYRNRARVFLPLVLVVGSITLAGCAITGPPCSDVNHCVLSASDSNGQLVITRSENPSVNAIIPGPQPSPSFPATAYRECIAVNGDASSYDTWNPSGAPYRYECDDVHYVGSDGMTDYYVNIPVNGTTLPAADTAGTGATESECVKGWYPDASTGNPAGMPGRWDSAVNLCLPTKNGNSQLPGN